MFYFALANLALALVYYVFEWRDIAPTGHGFVGGVALAFLFSNADKIIQSKAWSLLIVGTVLVEYLLFYGYWQIEVPSYLLLATAAAILGSSVFAAGMAFWFKSSSDFIHIEVLAAFATILNSLFLISYLCSLLFK